MHDGRVEEGRELNQFRMRSCTAGPAQNGNLLRRVEKVGQRGTFCFRRANAWSRRSVVQAYGSSLEASRKATSPGMEITETPPCATAVLDPDLEYTGHLLRLRDKLAEMAALGKNMFRMSLLKIAASYLFARDLGGNGKYWDSTSVAVVEAVDQM